MRGIDGPGRHGRAIAGAGVFFGSNGAAFASLLPWYPLLIQRLELEVWVFGFVVAAFAVGAIVSSVLPQRLIARFGPVPVVVVGTVLIAAAVSAAGWAANGWVLAACVFVAGFADAIVDVAENVVGVAVQNASGRSILSSMHALWSLGGVGGGAAATAAAVAGVDVRLYLPLAGAAAILLAVLGALLVRGAAGAERRTAALESDAGDAPVAASTRARWIGALRLALPLVVIAICGMSVEDIANNWAAISAVQIGGMGAQQAGIAFTVVIGSQCLGRFSGDVLIQRFGRAAVGRVGGLLIALGGIAIVAAQSPVQLLVGLAAIGFGSATLVPSAFSAAAELPGTSTEAGITIVSWLMRVAFLLTSPLIGGITTGFGLRWGLAILIAVGLAATLLAGRLAPPRTEPGTR